MLDHSSIRGAAELGDSPLTHYGASRAAATDPPPGMSLSAPSELAAKNVISPLLALWPLRRLPVDR